MGRLQARLRRPRPGFAAVRRDGPLHGRRRCAPGVPQARHRQPRGPQPRHRLCRERRSPLRAPGPRRPRRVGTRRGSHTPQRLRQPRHGAAAELGRVLVRLRLRPHARVRAVHARRGGGGRRVFHPVRRRPQRRARAPGRRSVHRHRHAAALRMDLKAHLSLRGPRHRRNVLAGHGYRRARPGGRDRRRSHGVLGFGRQAQRPGRRRGRASRAATGQRRRRPGHQAGARGRHHARVPSRARRHRRLHDLQCPPLHPAVPAGGPAGPDARPGDGAGPARDLALPRPVLLTGEHAVAEPFRRDRPRGLLAAVRAGLRGDARDRGSSRCSRPGTAQGTTSPSSWGR